ncbi:hypothetical protein KUH03_17410 [Sphingobacterium sp. E70]|uniref:hypothetical protein n=1 Tax=Sphingobacterium sp. E70 TaxID=2853439 RepID=UPI00211BC325|nr:hypothetical protein [Sphingobacterium sp. E70]ULT28209.1 hypothetical protein KUH03_17410 [Sphingobacterium sp. E70]
MKKTFHFRLPEVDQFSHQVKAFLPKLADSALQRYEDSGIQLVEEYIDYHSVIFYRLQAHVQVPNRLSIETCKADYHLLYNLHSPTEIILEQASGNSRAALPPHAPAISIFPMGLSIQT